MRFQFPSTYVRGQKLWMLTFLYPGRNACRAARGDLAYLEPCISDLCSNGILIDTMGPTSH